MRFRLRGGVRVGPEAAPVSGRMAPPGRRDSEPAQAPRVRVHWPLDPARSVYLQPKGLVALSLCHPVHFRW